MCTRILYNFLQGALKFSTIFTIYYQFLTFFVLCLHIFYNLNKYYQLLTLVHYLQHLYKYLQFIHNFYKFSTIFYKFSYYFHQFLEMFRNFYKCSQISSICTKYLYKNIIRAMCHGSFYNFLLFSTN